VTTRTPLSTSPDAVTGDLHAFVRHLTRATAGDLFRLAAELDLTLTQLRILSVLATAEAKPSLMDLAAGIGLSTPTTGRAVDALVRGGLVSRAEDDEDRRVKRHALTARRAARRPARPALTGLGAAELAADASLRPLNVRGVQ
jgi:DNA-binding MarR family transcriptional regulator